MVKQPAWAAAMSSSGLVPVPSSKREGEEYWRVAEEAALDGEIVQLHADFGRSLMRAAGHDYDARAGMPRDRRENACNEHEVAEIVDDKLLLQPVHLLQARQHHDPGVGNHAVHLPAAGQDVGDGLLDRSQVAEIAGQGRRPAAHARAGIFRRRQIPSGRDHVRAMPGQDTQRFEAEAGIADRSANRLAAKVDPLQHLFRC